MFENKTEDRFRRHIVDRLQAAALGGHRSKLHRYKPPIVHGVTPTHEAFDQLPQSSALGAGRLNTLLSRPLLATIVKSTLPKDYIMYTTMALPVYLGCEQPRWRGLFQAFFLHCLIPSYLKT